MVNCPEPGPFGVCGFCVVAGDAGVAGAGACAAAGAGGGAGVWLLAGFAAAARRTNKRAQTDFRWCFIMYAVSLQGKRPVLLGSTSPTSGSVCVAGFSMVGTTGFEPATSPTPNLVPESEDATRKK